MKKITKILCLLMVLVLGCSMFTGCITTNEDTEATEDASAIKMTVGIPVAPGEEGWAAWEPMLATWVEDFKTFSNVELKFTKIPAADDAEGWADFSKKVKRGKIAAFLTERNEYVEKMIDKDESIMSIRSIQAQYEAIMEEINDPMLVLSAEPSDRINYMIPVYGTYQGLYYNRTLFKQMELENPTSWENLLAAIEAFKEKGITPIAAGFADEGLEYMMDEMILSEGGVGEHSYTPSLGIISSWERALGHVQDLEKMGAFTKDCYNTSFEDALASFQNGSAAMIVAPSTVFGGALKQDDVKVVGLPKTPTGRREAGAFIGRYSFGIYVSRKAFYDNTRSSDAITDLIGKDYMGSDEFYQIYENEGTMPLYATYFDYNADSKMDEAVKALLKGENGGDWPIRQRLYTSDNIFNTFRVVLKGGKHEILQDATDAEIEARNAAIKAKEEEKK